MVMIIFDDRLYPYAMIQPKPIGIPKLVKGFIELDKFFGFLFVEIITPNDFKIPFLPFKSDDGLLVPLSTWRGWYFSEEIKYAVSLGYKVNILNVGYSFDKGQPFDSFVFYILNHNHQYLFFYVSNYLFININSDNYNTVFSESSKHYRFYRSFFYEPKLYNECPNKHLIYHINKIPYKLIVFYAPLNFDFFIFLKSNSNDENLYKYIPC